MPDDQSFAWLRRLVPAHYLAKIATLGPCGYWGKAPGTIGSAIGIVVYSILFIGDTPGSNFFWSLAWFYLAVGICGAAQDYLHKKDPPEVILDEFVAIPFCFLDMEKILATTPVWWWMLLGFGVFRFFDIVKPFGIRRLQSIKGGLGVVLDDIAAALATCVVLHLFYHFTIQ